MSEIKNHSPNLLHSFLLFEYDDVKPSKSSDGIVTMRGVIQAAGKPNANNRIYPRPILEREDKKYQELISDRRSLGELDHPDSPIVQLENVAISNKPSLRSFFSSFPVSLIPDCKLRLTCSFSDVDLISSMILKSLIGELKP